MVSQMEEPTFTLDTGTAGKKRVYKPMTFKLDGVVYPFQPSDTGGIVAAFLEDDTRDAMVQMSSWLKRGLSDDSFKEIMARLKDNDDPFDLGNFRQLIEGLIGVVANRPFTSSDESPVTQKPIGKRSTGSRSRKGTIPKS